MPREKDPNKLEARRLAEQALAVDPTEPRVQSTAGMFSWYGASSTGPSVIDLARSMNPNDASIQIMWAWAQACFGRAERGLPAAELAFRLNPGTRAGTATISPGSCFFFAGTRRRPRLEFRMFNFRPSIGVTQPG